jgi:hypothetical protein
MVFVQGERRGDCYSAAWGGFGSHFDGIVPRKFAVKKTNLVRLRRNFSKTIENCCGQAGNLFFGGRYETAAGVPSSPTLLPYRVRVPRGKGVPSPSGREHDRAEGLGERTLFQIPILRFTQSIMTVTSRIAIPTCANLRTITGNSKRPRNNPGDPLRPTHEHARRI